MSIDKDNISTADLSTERDMMIAANRVSANLVETTVTFYGNRTTIAQTIRLLSYIRNAIQNNQQKEIVVKIGNNVMNTQFSFDANGYDVPDLRAKDEIEIN